MAEVYVINLRHALKAPKRKRAAKAITQIRSYVERIVKDEDVMIDPSLNEKIWEMGIQNVPSKVKVKVEDQEDGSVLVTPA
ncbi:MAG: 50S ribosomal protein L31e [Desulfatiglandales bacterium]